MARKKRVNAPAFEQFKLEIASDLGIPNYGEIDKGMLPSRVNGMVGGMMVRRLIAYAEQALAQHNGLPAGNIDELNTITQEEKETVQRGLQVAAMYHLSTNGAYNPNLFEQSADQVLLQ